jgi:hypothetical protein
MLKGAEHERRETLRRHAARARRSRRGLRADSGGAGSALERLEGSSSLSLEAEATLGNLGQPCRHRWSPQGRGAEQDQGRLPPSLARRPARRNSSPRPARAVRWITSADSSGWRGDPRAARAHRLHSREAMRLAFNRRAAADGFYSLSIGSRWRCGGGSQGARAHPARGLRRSRTPAASARAPRGLASRRAARGARFARGAVLGRSRTPQRAALSCAHGCRRRSLSVEPLRVLGPCAP